MIDLVNQGSPRTPASARRTNRAGPTALIEYVSSAQESKSPRAFFLPQYHNSCGNPADAASVHRSDAPNLRLEMQDAALAARMEIAAHNVADLDRRLNQVDLAIEEAAQRGKTNTALSAMEGQRRARAGLAGERNEVAGALGSPEGRTSLPIRPKPPDRDGSRANPLRAELVGADIDSERAIRWLIAPMVLCDPLAIALTAEALARRSITA
jgi:hypothetical protein